MEKKKYDVSNNTWYVVQAAANKAHTHVLWIIFLFFLYVTCRMHKLKIKGMVSLGRPWQLTTWLPSVSWRSESWATDSTVGSAVIYLKITRYPWLAENPFLEHINFRLCISY